VLRWAEQAEPTCFLKYSPKQVVLPSKGWCGDAKENGFILLLNAGRSDFASVLTLLYW
jgi:hypothetical protein